MSWEKEVEDIRRREALAENMGGDGEGGAAAWAGKARRARTDPAAARYATAFARSARLPDGAAMMMQANCRLCRLQLHLRTRADQRTACSRNRRRLHRPRRRGGCGIASQIRAGEKMAHEMRLPLIRMIDGTGGGGSVKSLEDMGFTYVPVTPGWEDIVTNLETVPVVALALGPDSRHGRRAHGCEPLFDHGQRPVPVVRRRTGSRSPDRRSAVEGGIGRL